MDDYKDVYFRRLNRYGLNYQSRRLNQRKEEFDNYLLKSSYRIDINYNECEIPASFERNKQDETEITHYLLTHLDVRFPNGTILQIPNIAEHGQCEPWMVWYLEEQNVRAYNRYMMLRMTHHATWCECNDGSDPHESLCYVYGQEDNMLKNEVRSRSRMNVLYTENLKLSFMVMPRNEFIQKENIVKIGEAPFYEEYRVTGYDIQSTPGVEYVSIDPTYIHDFSEPPEKKPTDSDDDFFWLNGGN